MVVHVSTFYDCDRLQTELFVYGQCVSWKRNGWFFNKVHIPALQIVLRSYTCTGISLQISNIKNTISGKDCKIITWSSLPHTKPLTTRNARTLTLNWPLRLLAAASRLVLPPNDYAVSVQSRRDGMRICCHLANRLAWTVRENDCLIDCLFGNT